ncbi:MAG: hypothetical protein AB1938_00940 [Myxococcota bacterium]
MPAAEAHGELLRLDVQQHQPARRLLGQRQLRLVHRQALALGLLLEVEQSGEGVEVAHVAGHGSCVVLHVF